MKSVTPDNGDRIYCCGTLTVDIDTQVEADGRFSYDDRVIDTQDVYCSFDSIEEAAAAEICAPR